MEPKNHPIEKEHHLNQTSMLGLHVNLPGCTIIEMLQARPLKQVHASLQNQSYNLLTAQPENQPPE